MSRVDSVNESVPGTGRRRAMLIGITETRDLGRDPGLALRFPALDCADRDVELVGKALEQSEYDVTAHYPGHSDPTHRKVGLSALIGRLYTFFDSCEPGDTAFVYVSCHGETLAGRDYLIPADAQPGRLLPDGSRALLANTLLAADPGPGGLLEGLKHGVTATVCLDMCRTSGPRPEAEISRALLVPDSNEVFWLHSSSRGQASYADPLKGSNFGRALSEALSPTTPPTTFYAILTHTKNRVRALSRDLTTPPPDIQAIIPHQRREVADHLVLCKGSQETLRWTRSVTECELWAHTSGTPEVHDRVKAKLSALVDHVAESRAGHGAHLDDPWGDPAYPERVAEQLGQLVARAKLKDEDRLSPAETAVLLAAPVVYEGIVAVVLEELRDAFGDHMDADADRTQTPPTGHLKQVHDAATDVCRAHAQVQRTAQTLRRRGLPDAALAADLWLRHRFIADWDRPWEQGEDYPGVDNLISMTADAVSAAADASSADRAPGRTLDLLKRQIRQVAGNLTVRPGSSPRINEAGQRDEWGTYPPVTGNQWRGRELAALLWTAGLLAADQRRMSGDLVDHLAAHRALVPREVVAALSSDFGYNPTLAPDGSYGLAVRFPCPHPALHAAVEELAGAADTTVRDLHESPQVPALLRGTPTGVSTRHLVPLDHRYEEPLERFRLAEDEIRPLLMGTQLYGDRMLAVRELYQNALDACRHRQMRIKYGASRGRPHTDWKAKIDFTQGWDDDGRPYIQCEDTGTGMTREKLTSMFARAGKRYEQDPDFVQERRNWRRAGLPDVALNSRFGIGVFSYFMLAEEVVVWTTPVDLNGDALSGGSQRAEIQAGSGLLQFRRDNDAPAHGGTRVRLYLTAQDEDEQLPSLVASLKSLLWVSDHEVTAVEFAKDDPREHVRREKWLPGELDRSGEWHGLPLASGSDTWIVQGEGQLLLDGVVVKNAESVYGHVINLRERHRPEPSVDRNRMLSYDKELVLSELLEAIPQAVEGWTEVSLPSLWELATEEPRLAVAVLGALGPDVIAVLEAGEGNGRLTHIRIPLSSVGCLPFDKAQVTMNSYQRNGFHPKRRHESDLLEAWQLSRLSLRTGPGAVFTPRTYPLPAELDALLFRGGDPHEDWRTALSAAALAKCTLADTTRALRRYAVAGLHVPATDDIRTLRELRPTPAMTDLHEGYMALAEQHREGDGRWPIAAHGPLVTTAALHKLTLGEAAALLRRLTVVDSTLPPAPVLDEHLAAERFQRDEVSLVHTPMGAATSDWLPAVLGPLDLLSRMPSTLPPEQLVRRVRQLAPLGLSLAVEPSADVLSRTGLTHNEKFLFSMDHDGVHPWRSQEMELPDVLAVSERFTTPVGAIIQQVKDAHSITGLTAPVVPTEVRDWVVPAWAGRCIRSRPPSGGALGAWAIVVTLWEGKEGPSREELENDLRMLGSCGLLTDHSPEALAAIVEQYQTQTHPLRPTVQFPFGGRSFGGHNIQIGSEFDEAGATPAVLLTLSARDKATIGDVTDQLESFPHHLPLPVAVPPKETRHLVATRWETSAFTDWEDGRSTSFRSALDIQDLLVHAKDRQLTLGDSIRHLSAFVPLGAPAPPGDFTGPDAEQLEGFAPDRFDLAAFDSGLLAPGSLGALELILVSGRFDWTIGATYDRYAPFRCLGLHVTARPTPEEAELTPDWRDVIILTEQLTGRAPALAGRVDSDHIRLCAEETDLAESEVRARLQQWSSLFSLELPPLEDQER